MTALLALLLLGELPGVALSDHGGAEKVVRHLNCTGAGVTCSSSSTFGTISVAGAPTLSIPTCSGGQATTANGSSFSCVSNVSTATALAANPTDCSANQYATTIAANGNLTCAQVTTAQLSGTVTNAQLASSYSGTGGCSSHNWASTLNANASPTCTQPAFSDLSGSPTAAQLGVVRVTGSNVTTSGAVTPVTTGLTFAIAANQLVGFHCFLSSIGTTTSLPRFSLNGPAGTLTGTNVGFTRYLTASTQAFLDSPGLGTSTAACTSGCSTATLGNYVDGAVVNGTNAGTLDVQVLSSTAAQTVTVLVGSWCEFH